MKGRWAFTASCLRPLKHICWALPAQPFCGRRKEAGLVPGPLHKAIPTQDRQTYNPSFQVGPLKPQGAPEALGPC